MRWSAAFSARAFFCAIEARNWLRPSTSSPARFISISSVATLTRMLSSTTDAGAVDAGRQPASPRMRGTEGSDTGGAGGCSVAGIRNRLAG